MPKTQCLMGRMCNHLMFTGTTSGTVQVGVGTVGAAISSRDLRPEGTSRCEAN
jgi:hypothetical protein